jgi:hypothetical protein
MASLFVRSMDVMPSSAKVFSVVVPSALVTCTLKADHSASPESSAPFWLVSNTLASASMSLSAEGSQSVNW